VQSQALEDALSQFMEVRPRLFGIAYRMLGSAAEAEDIVQDVWLRWQGTDRTVVRDAPAFLATATTRLAINRAQSASSRRETYIGPWLPEPVDTSADPHLGAERGEALKLAVLALLEKLSPMERAAYVLREAFAYEYVQVAEIIDTTEVNARQLVSRARKHLADRQRTTTGERAAAVSAGEQRRLLQAFIAAAQRGELAELEALFTEDVVSFTDGNGAARTARVPVEGRKQVAKFIAAFASFFWEKTTIAPREINGQPAVLITRGDDVVAVAAIEASAEGIDQIFWLMNPDKLRAFTSSQIEAS
jgi:RNA polymerase sigma-70 factor (TIGR02957 family)